MYFRKLVPDSFEVPAGLETEQFVLEPLGIRQLSRDVEAALHGDLAKYHNASNLERFGKEEPSPEDMTLDFWALHVAAMDEFFHYRENMQYAILSPDRKQELGCVYIMPSQKAGLDADLIMWIRQDRDDAEALDQHIFSTLQQWVKDVWPFDKVGYPQREIGWDEWQAMPDKNQARWQEQGSKSVLVPRRLVPLDFKAPDVVETEFFQLSPLNMATYACDLEACLASTEGIKQQLPVLAGRWPATPFDAERVYARIANEVQLRMWGTAFGYSITTKGLPTISLGAVHIHPSYKVGYEAEVYFWIRESEMDSGLQEGLYEFTRAWLQQAWPFDMDKVLWPGRSISWDDWQALPEIESPSWG